MKSFLHDLVTGWDQTMKKWSVQISAMEAPVMGLLYASAALTPLWVLPLSYIGFWLARICASNLTQADCKNYDPTTHGLYDLKTQKPVWINRAGEY